MTPTHKVHARIVLDVPKFDDPTQSVTLYPEIIEARWTKNNHLVADELAVTVGYKEAGIDPRYVKNARCAFFMWNDAVEDFDPNKHLRFTGIGQTVERKLGDNGWNVEITFHDYTSLFLACKPMKSSGMPEWNDTLEQIWQRICDNTGWTDPETGKVKSSVTALRDGLRFQSSDDLRSKTLGELVPQRFHAISKPHPRTGASSWDVWQWCIGSLGLISYIDKDECIVTSTTEHFSELTAPAAVYGLNIHSLEEKADASMSNKGILLKSMNQVTGEVLEAFYPLPGDERLKVHRGAANKKSEGGTAVTSNEQSADYEEYNRYDIQTQAALDAAARAAYEERSRQELRGKFRTSEIQLSYEAQLTEDISQVDTADLWELGAGDCIRIVVDPDIDKDTLNELGGDEERVRYLVDRCDYDEDVARVIVQNYDALEFASQIFHVGAIHFELGPDKYDVEVEYHNKILTNV